MDLKAYIESGILERYALGDTNAAESREVEQLAAQHPDVKAELQSIQASLELYAGTHSIQPPVQLKQKIWQQLNAPEQTTSTSRDGNVVDKSFAPKVVSIGRYNTLLAAASVALLVSLASNFYLYQRWDQTSAQLASLQSEQTELAKQFEVKRASLEKTQQELALITQPSVKAVALKGTSTNPDALAIIYWNSATHDVFILANHLPKTPTDKQYQLWAIVNGKPVDAGMMDVNDVASLQKMKSFESAQAFAITVERIGGSPTPTLESMVVIGNI